MNIGKATDIGCVREHNEDSILALTSADNSIGLFAVADGLGGHNKGEVASSMAVQQLEKGFAALSNGGSDEGVRLERLIHEANKAIFDHATENPECSGMGTTMTAALAIDSRLWIAQVGDSRAYLVNDGKIVQITKDHSLVQEMIDAGKITAEDPGEYNRNIITRAVGISPDVDVDVYERTVYNNDRLVLCSDGLTTMVSDGEIKKIVQEHTPQDACNALIALANKNAGYDNISVIIVHFDTLESNKDILANKTVVQN